MMPTSLEPPGARRSSTHPGPESPGRALIRTWRPRRCRLTRWHRAESPRSLTSAPTMVSRISSGACLSQVIPVCLLQVRCPPGGTRTARSTGARRIGATWCFAEDLIHVPPTPASRRLPPLRRAGLDRKRNGRYLGLHHLRSMNSSIMDHEGVDTKTARFRRGHASGQSGDRMGDLYTRTTPRRNRMASEKIHAVLRRQPRAAAENS